MTVLLIENALRPPAPCQTWPSRWFVHAALAEEVNRTRCNWAVHSGFIIGRYLYASDWEVRAQIAQHCFPNLQLIARRDGIALSPESFPIGNRADEHLVHAVHLTSTVSITSELLEGSL